MALITSRSNPQIKLLRSLLDRRRRDRTRLFLVEGWRPVREAMDRGARLQSLVYAEELCGTEEWRIMARHQGERLPVTPEVLASLSAGHQRPALIAVAAQSWTQLNEVTPAGDGLWLAVEGIRHPGSLGTLLRTCDAVGAEGVALLGECVDPHDPSCINASHGAVFSQHLVRTSFLELARWAAEHGCRLIGTSPAGRCDYRAASYQRPIVVMMGGQQGLRPDELELCDQVVRIPMLGRCDSHHVVVASALVLYEIARRDASADNQWKEGKGYGTTSRELPSQARQ
ncbi:MAG: TrmH family RNA methyltransferase [Armatimonadota bacterium]